MKRIRTMRSVFVTIASVAVMFLVAPLFAVPETITGRIVDEDCYRKDKANSGLNHKMPAAVTRCAEICAKKGQPLALLTRDGRIFTLAGPLIANKNANVIPHLGHIVRVTGEVTTKAGKMTVATSALTMEVNEDS